MLRDSRGVRTGVPPTRRSLHSWAAALSAAVFLAVWIVVPSYGFPAGVYVVSATFNGSSTTTVALGASVEIAVTVDIVGGEGTDSWWCSTHCVLECPEAGVRVEECVPDPSPDGGCYCNWGCLAASWQWESLATARFVVDIPSVAGVYDVTLCASTQEDGCSGGSCAPAVKFADAITAMCDAGHTPMVELGAARTLTCTNPSAALTASVTGGTGPFTYSWTPGGATSQTVTVTSAGTYFVKVTGANGCSASDTVTVTDDKTPPAVEAGGPYELSCAAPILVLDAEVSGGTAPYAYLWTPGGLTTQTISVNTVGTYTLTVTGANGCSASDTVAVTEASSAEDLVSNGAFESGFSMWRLYPDAGALSSPVFSITAFATPRETSLACLDLGWAWLQSAAVGTSGPTMLVQDVTANLVSGGLYRLSCWMRRDAEASSSPAVAILYVSADGTTPADGVAVEVLLPSDADAGEWVYCRSDAFVFTLPSGCAQAWVALWFTSSAGTAWWDNVSLQAVAP